MLHDPFSQVVDPFGGAMDEVLSLQSYAVDEVAIGVCLSTVSCPSSPSCRSQASCNSTASFVIGIAEPAVPIDR